MSYSNIAKNGLLKNCVTAGSFEGLKLHTEEACLKAVINNVNALPFCKVLTPRIIEEALRRDNNALKLIPTRAGFEAWKIAVSMYPESIFEAPVLDERLCQIAVCKNPRLFPSLKNTPFSIKLFEGMIKSYFWDRFCGTEHLAAMLKELEPKFWNLLIARNPNCFSCTPQTPESCLSAVRYNGDFLKIVKDKTPEVCLEAVKNRYTAIAYVPELTPVLFIAALEEACKVNRFEEAFKRVSSLRKPSEEIVLACLEKYPRLISHVSKEARMRAIEKVPQSAMFLPSKEVTFKIAETVFDSVTSESNSYSLKEWAVSQNPLLFPKLKNKNKDSFMKMIQSNAWYKLSLGHKFNVMKRLDPYYSVILVRQDPMAFEYSLQTEETCLIGVKHNGLNLQYVKNKTPRVCMEALIRDHRALKWVPEPTTEMYAIAVRSAYLYNFMDSNFIHKIPNEQLFDVLKMSPVGMRFLNREDKTMEFCRKDYTLCRFARREFLSQEFLEELAADSEEVKMYLYSLDLLKVETFEEAEKLVSSVSSSSLTQTDLFRFVKYVTQNLTPLPEGINALELEDPVSCAAPEVGEIGAFFSISDAEETEKVGEHFALTVNSIIALKKAGYICPDKTASTYEMVLVPKLNRSVSIKELKWHRF